MTRKSSSALTGERAVPRYTPTIALRSIDGHIARTGEQVWAWYRLAPQRWSFRTDALRNDLITAIAGQYAELQGRWLHLRVTSSPWPIDQWARAHVDNARHRPADVAGALSFDDYLVGEQQQLAGGSMAEKEVYLGVEVRTRGLLNRAVDRVEPVLRRVAPKAVEAELTALTDEIDRLDQIIAAPGLEGQPASPTEMRWLLTRSCGLGLPAPSTRAVAPADGWGPEDLAAVTETAELSQKPYSPTVTVTGTAGCYAGLERHVAVLSVGTMHGLQIPEVDEPWVQRADRLGAAVEWSARIYVRRGQDVEGELLRQTQKVTSQVKHFTEEHDLDAPQSLARQAAQVSEIDDEMTTGFTALASRVRSWWRVAVAADSEREATAAAQQLVDLYKPKVAIEHPEAQYKLAREFIPGEPLATSVHQRRGSVIWAAAAVPAATAEVGDRRGVLLGETCTATRRPVAWDPWMAQEIRDRSGLTALVAGLGGGKSFLGGGLVYKTLRSGASWTVLDPSGPLAELCELPELAPYARRIDLTRAEAGILNPYRVVAEPSVDYFADEPDPRQAFEQERAIAAATRRRLVLDVLTGLLPYEIQRLPATKIVLLRAVREVGGAVGNHPGLVFAALRRDATEHAEHARVVADFLDEMRERLALLIPAADADPYVAERDDRLTVLTLAGLTLPKDGIGREHWTDAEATAIELVNLAAWLTQRSVYDRPKHERKGVWIDEAFFLSEVPTGRVLMNRFARDSRKWNVRVLLSSQVPADFLRIEGFTSLLDSAFVGRIDGEVEQREALQLLGVDTGVGYEQTIARLGRRPGAEAATRRNTEPRQFLFADGAGGVERIRVDFSGAHLRRLRAALDTTPQYQPALGPSTAQPRSDGQATDQSDNQADERPGATSEEPPATPATAGVSEQDLGELAAAFTSPNGHAEEVR